ncbi:lasso peptide isopeptide bond-forming cyclase [Caulobacter sp. FWC2]|uniref:lasso peptide isopeptide bond-forming cyclase n=1 Tax=Caulobacter sp. FWC2 TaxID=69664 RepID=UPI000C15DAE6|nr:lasso peptide isopeptide bond-forming cyclase [Caulobacter sp. FWC2]PIB92609.1 asparagine synthase [Caulobacter sp. FWC2]
MGYVVLTHPPGAASLAFEEMLEALTVGGGWTLAHQSFRLAVLTESRVPPRVTPLVGRAGVAGVLVGRVFDRAATAAGAVATANLVGMAEIDPLEGCERLIQRAWGTYLGVWIGHSKAGPTILRDPSGGFEVLVWRRDDVTVVSSRPIVGRAGPVGLAIDWPRVAQIIADPISATIGPPPLTGLTQVDPGVALHGPDLRDKVVLWSPATVVRGGRGRPWPSRADLRRTVDGCVAALADGPDRMVCEISGGLDSAIVATSLAAQGLGPTATVNFYGDQPEADERRYAQAVADRIGVPLRTVRRTPFAFDAAILDVSGRDARPNFNALDATYDAGLIEALVAADAKALFTGHGGDTVFYQVAASALAADLLRGEPCEGSRLQRLEEVARRTRRSIWSLSLEALTGRASALSIEGQLLRKEAEQVRRAGPSHPWVADTLGVPVAKRRQIRALVSNLTANGATGRGERARIVHPLLAQPVVEVCLAIPAPVLSAGERERSFAREAFADRLPSLVVERRSKGEISVHLNRCLAASGPFLRDFLLGGRLAARGLVDGLELAAALEPEAIVWKDASREILTAAALEAWVRHWEGRIAGDAATPPPPTFGVEGGATGPNASARNANAR